MKAASSKGKGKGKGLASPSSARSSAAPSAMVELSALAPKGSEELARMEAWLEPAQPMVRLQCTGTTKTMTLYCILCLSVCMLFVCFVCSQSVHPFTM